MSLFDTTLFLSTLITLIVILDPPGVVYLFMRFAGTIRAVLRESGTMLLTRIAGLLLSAIAVQMIANSVQAFVTGSA